MSQRILNIKMLSANWAKNWKEKLERKVSNKLMKNTRDREKWAKIKLSRIEQNLPSIEQNWIKTYQESS